MKAWNLLMLLEWFLKNKCTKILPELWMEFVVFSWADFIRKSSNSREMWHNKPEFLCKSVPLSRGAWTWTWVTVLWMKGAQVWWPLSIALMINWDRYLNSIDKLQIKSCVGLCSLKFTTDVLSPSLGSVRDGQKLVLNSAGQLLPAALHRERGGQYTPYKYGKLDLMKKFI